MSSFNVWAFGVSIPCRLLGLGLASGSQADLEPAEDVEGDLGVEAPRGAPCGTPSGPGSVGHGGQEEAVRLGVPGVFEGRRVRGCGEPRGRARPHDAGLELGLVEGGDAHAAGRAARVRRG